MDPAEASEAPDTNREAHRSVVAGARAGRGFRYQDAVAAFLAVTTLTESLPWLVTPEGHEDISLEGPDCGMQVQVRSRRDQRTDVSPGQLAAWIAELWSRHIPGPSSPTRHIAVAIDRPVIGVPHTGLVETLGAVEVESLRAALGGRVPKESIGQILAHTHLLVVPDPVGEATRRLAEQREIPPVVAELAVRKLQATLGQLADDRPICEFPAERGALGLSDMARIVDDTVATVNIDALEQPIRDGVCEHADLFTPMLEDAFYLGVDVVPGHVVSGLVLDRPDDVTAVVNALEHRGSALVVGPSGSGKTALAWLSAYATRHSVRWLRVSSSSSDEIPQLLRYVRSLMPTLHTPVGLIIDDVGDGRERLWEDLMTETRHIPGVWTVGTVREEDLGLLPARGTPIVRCRLAEPLAERLWRELSDRGQTQAAGWRESFDAAEGLMLEYVFLLTTGGRLQDTIEAQVQRRRDEQRDLELRVLRIASIAAMRGGTTDLPALRVNLDVSDEDLQRALERLLEEHLIHRVDVGGIGGLHWLRSQAISQAVHRIPPPSVKDTAEQVLHTVRIADLGMVLADLLDEATIDETAAGAVLRERLAAAQNPAVLAACLDGFREYGLARQARRWQQIMDDAGVAPAQREVTALMAVARVDAMEFLDLPVRQALEQLQTDVAADPRPRWLASLPSSVLEQVALAVADPAEALELLHAFHLLDSDATVDVLAPLAEIAKSSDLASLSALIKAAADVDLGLADRFVDAAGGVEHLLARANCELAFVTDVQYGGRERPEVDFRWLYVDREAQPDVNEAVVGLCRLFAGLFPRAVRFNGLAVDASGRPAGTENFPLADKRIPRENLPGEVDVRWNQALRHRLERISDATSRTDRLKREAHLVESSAKLAWTLAERFVRSDQPTIREAELVQELARESLRIGAFQSGANEIRGDGTGTARVGTASEACRDLWGNAIPRLFQAPNWSLAAFLHDTIHEKLKRLDPQYWRLLESAPEQHVGDLVELIDHLYAYVCELAENQGRPATSRMRRASRRAGRAAVAAAARVARDQAEARLENRVQSLKRRLEELGRTCDIVRRRPGKPSAVCWPSDEVAVVVDVPSLYDWLRHSEELVVIVDEVFEPVRSVAVIPRRDGRLVVRFAQSGHLHGGQVTPAFDSAGGWDEFGLVSASMPTCERVAEALNSAVVLSALNRLEEARDLVDEERKVAERAFAELEMSLEYISTAATEDQTGFLADVLSPLGDMLARENLAEQFARATRGEQTEEVITATLLTGAAAEWDIRPETASVLTEEFLAST